MRRSYSLCALWVFVCVYVRGWHVLLARDGPGDQRHAMLQAHQGKKTKLIFATTTHKDMPDGLPVCLLSRAITCHFLRVGEMRAEAEVSRKRRSSQGIFFSPTSPNH
ncbi:hypothetical protein L209DRAFT_429278 [Thermothelomyces heterothallicus CBS 203.75]